MGVVESRDRDGWGTGCVSGCGNEGGRCPVLEARDERSRVRGMVVSQGYVCGTAVGSVNGSGSGNANVNERRTVAGLGR